MANPEHVTGVATGAVRLRSKLIAASLIGIALNAFVWFGLDVPTAQGWSWLAELLASAVIAYAMHHMLIKRHVDDTVFRQAPMTKARRFGILVFCAVSILLSNVASVRDWILATPLPHVVLYSFLFSTLLSLIWLIRHERRKGIVYIFEERPPTATI